MNLPHNHTKWITLYSGKYRFTDCFCIAKIAVAKKAKAKKVEEIRCHCLHKVLLTIHDHVPFIT